MEFVVEVHKLSHNSLSPKKKILSVSGYTKDDTGQPAFMGVLTVGRNQQFKEGDTLRITVVKERPLPSEPPPAWSQ